MKIERGDVIGIMGAPAQTGKVSWMKEPYGEGVASRTGPESCGGAREGVVEALTGVCAGWVLSREINDPGYPGMFGVPMLSMVAEGHIDRAAHARHGRTPRGLRPHACTETPCTGAGRSRVRPWPGTTVRAEHPQGERRR